MPLLVNISVGSLPGTSGLDATTVWPLEAKKSRKVLRMSATVATGADVVMVNPWLLVLGLRVTTYASPKTLYFRSDWCLYLRQYPLRVEPCHESRRNKVHSHRRNLHLKHATTHTFTPVFGGSCCQRLATRSIACM